MSKWNGNNGYKKQWGNNQGMGFKKQTSHDGDSRIGAKWEKEEDADLIREIENNMTIEDIAKAHKRTQTSIKSRIMLSAINAINDGGDKTEVCAKFRILKEELEDFMVTKKVPYSSNATTAAHPVVTRNPTTTASSDDTTETSTAAATVNEKKKKSSSTGTLNSNEAIELLREIRGYLKIIAEKNTL